MGIFPSSSGVLQRKVNPNSWWLDYCARFVSLVFLLWGIGTSDDISLSFFGGVPRNQE